MYATPYLLALLAGVSFVFQQGVNSNLRMEISSAWWAGFASYLGGTIVMLLAALALSEPLPLALIGRIHPLSWMGGVFGAIYIAISILTLPKLGAGMVIALIVAGQMIGSLIFDHYGILGVPVHEISATRLLGGALLLVSVVLISW